MSRCFLPLGVWCEERMITQTNQFTNEMSNIMTGSILINFECQNIGVFILKTLDLGLKSLKDSALQDSEVI